MDTVGCTADKIDYVVGESLIHQYNECNELRVYCLCWNFGDLFHAVYQNIGKEEKEQEGNLVRKEIIYIYIYIYIY